MVAINDSKLTGAFFLFKHTDKSLAYFGVKSCAGCLDIRGEKQDVGRK